jgi:hypothetical protein
MKAILAVALVFISVTGIMFLMTDNSSAQSGPNPSQCEQIRQAVAQYGYRAAKRHAVANYGREAADAGERCLTKQDRKG